MIGEYKKAALFYEKGCSNLEIIYSDPNEFPEDGEHELYEYSDSEAEYEEKDGSIDSVVKNQILHYENKRDVQKQHASNSRLMTLSRLNILSENFDNARKLLEMYIINLCNTHQTNLDFFIEIENCINMLVNITKIGSKNEGMVKDYEEWKKTIIKAKHIFE